MSSDFVHLHLHSDYSMLDGACQIDRLCKKVKSLGQKAVAITDHGVMFGALDLYKAAKKEGLKAIVGCEFYVCPNGIKERSNIRYHLVLLAKNYEGYQTLCRLNRIAWSDDGYYYKPRIDHEALKLHHDNLICMSACVAGEIQQHVIDNNDAAARQALEFYRGLFGEDFYLEIQYHAKPGTRPADVKDSRVRELLELEEKVNARFMEYSREYGIGLVATNDAHYLNEGDYEAHDALLCIGTQSNLGDEKRFRFSGDQFYLKSTEEMVELFKDYPGAVENTAAIADKCELVVPMGANHYPVYRLDDKSDQADNPNCPVRRKFLRDICLRGLESRYKLFEADNPAYAPKDGEPDLERRKLILERMEYELGVIDKMGYISYFLVVWDFINYARSINVPVGPGRGSGAGSIVAYLTGITDLDPLLYGLLFERFLNPDRVSPPDFDIDFCEENRGRVIEYVRNKYGSDCVAQIGTFGTLKAKAVLKDVARVMGVAFGDSNELVGLIPTDPKMTLDKALDTIPELKKRYDEEEWVREVFAKAKVLEGLNRNQSIHACGVIIGDQALENIVPLARGQNKEWITQYPAVPCEELGMLKMDFLGLKTLTIIQKAIDMVNAGTGGNFKPDDIPLDDSATFKLLNQGNTVAVFQLESGGMQDLCRKFGIEKIEEIIALVALYRPGPMEFIPTFINCKFGREIPEYDTKEMRELLSETYGIMVYQEQIMQVVQAVAGFSLAQADIMRRAIGKKKEDVLKQQGELFKEGCLKMGHNAEIAESIWQKILKFASYGFNKSHSACYGLMSYRTAYLKANHPAEFMAAVLTSELGNAEKIAFFIGECREMGIKILPPDVNVSDRAFTVDKGSIRFGLGAIKGVGDGVADCIIESRRKDGGYESFLDFCERCHGVLNSRVIDCLTKAGAFDSIGLKRSQILAVAEATMQMAQSRIRDRETGQGSLFDFLDADAREEVLSVPVPDIPEFEDVELLRLEKELLGFYVTGHPLARYEDLVRNYSSTTIRKLDEAVDNIGVRVVCMIRSLQRKISKGGKAFAVMTVEDLDSGIECMLYGNTLERIEQKGIELSEGMPILLDALTSKRDESERIKLVAEDISRLDGVLTDCTREIHLHLYEGGNGSQVLRDIRALCAGAPGKSKLILCVTCLSGEIAFIEASGMYRVKVDEQFLAGVKSILGERRYRLKADVRVPEPRRKFNAQQQQQQG